MGIGLICSKGPASESARPPSMDDTTWNLCVLVQQKIGLPIPTLLQTLPFAYMCSLVSICASKSVSGVVFERIVSIVVAMRWVWLTRGFISASAAVVVCWFFRRLSWATMCAGVFQKMLTKRGKYSKFDRMALPSHDSIHPEVIRDNHDNLHITLPKGNETWEVDEKRAQIVLKGTVKPELGRESRIGLGWVGLDWIRPGCTRALTIPVSIPLGVRSLRTPPQDHGQAPNLRLFQQRSVGPSRHRRQQHRPEKNGRRCCPSASIPQHSVGSQDFDSGRQALAAGHDFGNQQLAAEEADKENQADSHDIKGSGKVACSRNRSADRQ